MKIKIEPDLRTSAEWDAWARNKIANAPRNLTDEEVNEMRLGNCIEFDSKNPLNQKIKK
jgi:hypothetical protein